MGHTEVVPEGFISSQRPSDTIKKAKSALCIKVLSCAVVVLSALCTVVIGVLSWHITQSVIHQGPVFTPMEQESIKAKIEHDHEAMKYLQNTNLETVEMLESHKALIRSLQTDMQRDRREVQAKIDSHGKAIATNKEKLEKANKTITSIRTKDIKKLTEDVSVFSKDIIQLQEWSNAYESILRNLQENFDVHTNNITSLQDDSKMFSYEVESMHEELVNNSDDIEDLKSKYNNLTVKPRDCEDVFTTSKSAKSGIFKIYPTSNIQGCGLPVYCDMTTQGGGWIVIQRQQDGSETFYREWQDYKLGFGNLTSNFWLGLDNINALVCDGKWKLLINMRDDGKGEKYAMYKSFFVGPESGGYVLTVADFLGDAGDSLISEHNGMKFSTKDKDNDIHHGHCAVQFTGAWWYGKCHSSNLNGVYGHTEDKGPRWRTLSGHDPVEFVEMKIKKRV